MLEAHSLTDPECDSQTIIYPCLLVRQVDQSEKLGESGDHE
jgi:hypothetical protein